MYMTWIVAIGKLFKNMLVLMISVYSLNIRIDDMKMTLKYVLMCLFKLDLVWLIIIAKQFKTNVEITTVKPYLHCNFISEKLNIYDRSKYIHIFNNKWERKI